MYILHICMIWKIVKYNAFLILKHWLKLDILITKYGIAKTQNGTVTDYGSKTYKVI